MIRLSIFILSLGILLGSFPARAQGGKAIVESPSSKDLKRTAHRLRIPVEQIKNAREALNDATALAKKLEPSAMQPWALADMWIQLYRSKAFTNAESVYDHLRALAQEAATLNEYQQCISAAQGLLAPFFDLDSERVASLLRQWPQPSADWGQAAQQARDQFLDGMRRQSMQRMIYRDPERAMDLISAQTETGMPYYGTRAQLSQFLMNTGKSDKASDVIDQVLADFKKNPDPNSLQDYAGFVQQLSTISPDRFLNAFDLLVSAAAQPVGGAQPSVQLHLGGDVLMLSPSENAIVNVFRSMYGRPELAFKALSRVPALKDKLDAVGGIDSVLSPSMRPKTMMRTGSPDGQGQKPAGAQADPQVIAGELYQLLRGKWEKDPGMVRSKLAAAVRDPEQVDILIAVAQRASYEDPDLSAAALEIASPLVPQIKPLQRRSALLQNLIRVSRQTDGDVDPKLLREGFIIADQLREEEKERNPELIRRTRVVSMADQLESVLVSQLALDDFPTAIRFVRSMPDDPVKYAALMSILQSLRQQY